MLGMDQACQVFVRIRHTNYHKPRLLARKKPLHLLNAGAAKFLFRFWQGLRDYAQFASTGNYRVCAIIQVFSSVGRQHASTQTG